MKRFDPSKVYGGPVRFRGKQCRAIAYAPTKKRLLEITGQSAKTFRDYWCDTGNVAELTIANANRNTGAQEGVFVNVDGPIGKDYVHACEGECN